MGRLIDYNDVYNAIQITSDNFGVIKGVVESNMLTMLSKIETVEAIPKDQYEARLKAGMVAILNNIRAEIERMDYLSIEDGSDGYDKYVDRYDVFKIIDKYKAEAESEGEE